MGAIISRSKSNPPSPSLSVLSQKEQEAISVIMSMSDQIRYCMPSHLQSTDMMKFSTINMLRNNPKLLACNVDSILGAVFTAAQLGLNIGKGALNEAWIIPYAGEATFQIGYMGFIKLMSNTNLYRRIVGDKVKPGDLFEHQNGSGGDYYFRHSKKTFDRAIKPDYYFGQYETINGGRDHRVFSWQEMHDHAKEKSKSFQRGEGPWVTDFDAMAIKTSLKELCKRAPRNTELASRMVDNAFNVDQAIIRLLKDQKNPRIIEMEHTHEMPVERNEKGETQAQETIRKESEDRAETERLAMVEEIKNRVRDLHSKGMRRNDFENLMGVKLEAIDKLDIQSLYAAMDALK